SIMGLNSALLYPLGMIKSARTREEAEQRKSPSDPPIGGALSFMPMQDRRSGARLLARDAARVGRRRAIAPGHARHTVRELHAEDLFRGVPGVRCRRPEEVRRRCLAKDGINRGIPRRTVHDREKLRAGRKAVVPLERSAILLRVRVAQSLGRDLETEDELGPLVANGLRLGVHGIAARRGV